MNTFPRFDVVSDDASDHHYIDYYSFSTLNKAIYSKITKEWRILKESLPESIYVRVYDKRINLLRAVIVGVAGTPYHDGLFFFDIALPRDYPNSPPKVYYHSFGLRLNPNLYADGYVCLSLINTWRGTGNERWNPSGSTLLQVLLSIQALVLNEKPYYNEPSRVGFESASNAYNENVFILSCKTTLYLLRRPPRNFEAFVNGHFRERAVVILKACTAYANGEVRVGYYGSGSSSSTVVASSEFSEAMVRLYPQLLAAFRNCDASLEDSSEQLNLRIKGSKACLWICGIFGLFLVALIVYVYVDLVYARRS